MTHNGASVGEQLRNAREQLGYNIAEVAEYLRLSRKVLEALESDRHDELPDTPYVMGYIRAYSRLLKLDAEALLLTYQGRSQADEQEPSAINANDAEEEQSQVPGVSRFKRLLEGKSLLIVGVLVLLWIVASSFMSSQQQKGREAWQSNVDLTPSVEQQSPSELAASDGPVESQEPTARQAITAELETAAVTQTDTELSEASSQDAPVAEVAQPEAQAQPEPQQAPVVSESQEDRGLDTLSIVFSDECWLEVTDAAGDVIAVDLYQAGAEIELRGRAPFAVTLGNYQAAQLFLNGELQNLSSTRASKTLRTSIGSRD